jgi:predicted membrane protein
MRRASLGLLIILLGVVVLLWEFLPNADTLLRFWPLLIIAYAFAAPGITSTPYRIGLWAVGGILLVDALLPQVFGSLFETLWPVLLILLAIAILFGSIKHHDRRIEVKHERTAGDFAGRMERKFERKIDIEGTVREETASSFTKANAVEEEPTMTIKDAEYNSDAGRETAGGQAATAGTQAKYEGGSAHFFSELPEGISAVRCQIDFNVGLLQVAGATDKLFEIDAEIDHGIEPQVHVREEVQGDRKIAVLTVGQEFGSGRTPLNLSSKWVMRLNRNLPLELDCEVNAAKASLDLRELRVIQLVLENNAAKVELQLGERESSVSATVENNAAKAEIAVPASFGVKAALENNFGKHDFNESLPHRTNGTWRTEGYAESDKRIKLRVENNAGSIRLRRV